MEEFTYENLVKQLKELRRLIDDFVEDKCDRHAVFKKLQKTYKLMQKDIATTSITAATTPPCSGCRKATNTKTKEAERTIYS